MSKYTDITAAALKFAVAVEEQRTHCDHFARQINLQIQAHLNAPAAAVAYVNLNTDLAPNWDTQQTPHLVQGCDGFWYFATLLTFDLEGKLPVKAALTFGADWTPEKKYTIKFNRQYDIQMEDATAWEKLMDSVAAELQTFYTRRVGTSASNIGFIASKPK